MMVGLKSKLLLLVYKDLYDLVPAYLSDLLLYQILPSLIEAQPLHLHFPSPGKLFPASPHGSFESLRYHIISHLFSKAMTDHPGTVWHITLFCFFCIILTVFYSFACFYCLLVWEPQEHRN